MPVLTISVSTKQEFFSPVSQIIHSGFGVYITTKQVEAKETFSYGLSELLQVTWSLLSIFLCCLLPVFL